MRLVVSEEAAVDLDDILAYSVREWGAAQGVDYVRAINEAFGKLTAGTLSGTRADDLAPGLRRLVAGSHVVWFRVADDQLLVIRVLHQSRDAGRWVR
jgi:toxin ParE1/3/4